ncbi:hypothetical protein GCM10010300_00910 [Streptomyces olivaceoviridis]|nr:hypothetical protein GCM10010300_00910 [Streptomyces olivaceoviridis]
MREPPPVARSVDGGGELPGGWGAAVRVRGARAAGRGVTAPGAAAAVTVTGLFAGGGLW